MRFVLVAVAVLMPAVAYLSQTGALGHTNGELSDRYPTLLVAAGYAFAIWGVIFLLDLVHAVWAATGERATNATLKRVAPLTALGFAATGIWSPIFTLELFWLALIVIWVALAALAWSALQLRADPGVGFLGWGPVSLHAGWLALAAFLNVAQVLVAYEVEPIVPLSFGLFGLAAVVLLVLNARMRGNVAFAVAAVWGLAAVYVKQSSHALPGATAAAWVALAIAALLGLQTLALRLRARRPPSGTRAAAD